MASQTQSGVATRSHEHAYRSIPGLGMAFPRVAVPATQATENVSLQQPVPVDTLREDMEQGELSEGEIDNSYEPMEEDETVVISNDNLSGFDTGSWSNNLAASQQANPREREGSGSYSPHLSPSPPLESSRPSPHPHSSSHAPAKTVPHSATLGSEPSPVDGRGQAREAIARLWPMNYRFQHFLDQGIDQNVLRGLFNELGFDTSIPESLDDITKSRTPSAGERQEKDVTKTTAQQPKTLVASVVVKQKDEDSKASESRKDRIARLLAAKKGKSSSAASQLEDVKETEQEVEIPAGPKAMSEKSKLLRAKMMALQAARSALQKEQNLTPPKTNEPNGSAITDKESSGSGKDSKGPGIPGLSLPKKPDVAQGTSSLKRPVASDFDDLSQTPRPDDGKRRLEDSTDSKPFLIDVSDDDDDEDMDLDSPGPTQEPEVQEASLSNLLASRDFSSLTGSLQPDHLGSPRLSQTPTNSQEGAMGRANLANVTKKIEEMKRKIAEAEAKKRVRGERTASQTPSRNDETDFETDAGVDQLVSDAILAQPSPGLENRKSEQDVAPGPQSESFSPPSQVLTANQGDKRLSHSRPHGRLTLLEARRREQILKLKLLQSQVAAIEKDIEAAKKEEEAEILAESSQNSTRLSNGPGESLRSAESAAEEQVHEPEQSHNKQSHVDIEATQAGSGILGRPGDAKESDAPADVPDHDPIMPALESSQHTSQVDPPIPEFATNDISETRLDEMQDVVMDEAGDESTEEDTQSSGSASSAGGEQEVEQDDAIHAVNLSSKASSVDEGITSSAASSGSSSATHAGLNDSVATANVHGPKPAISAGDQDFLTIATSAEPVSPVPDRETNDTNISTVTDNEEAKSSFVPYQSPLSYFRAYRFHPKYKENVAGGLRSLTYSNQIDPRKMLCPDQVELCQCARGSQCEFQHFEKMKAPDDQILVQLGADASLDESRRQDFITGLRTLLTEFRSRKVKDFQTISDGIIAYRAQFHGDSSKILPLGGVSI